jgi:hypothetical protein
MDAVGGPGGVGVDGVVDALAVYDDGSGLALYVAGYFESAGGLPVHSIARWDGSSWSAVTGPVTDGVNGRILAMTVFEGGDLPVLVVGGHFVSAGGVTANNVARWTGGGWLPLAGPAGIGVDDWVYALASHDDGDGPALYAGGYFTVAGGLLVNHVARWDGDGWSGLGQGGLVGIDGTPLAFASFADDGGPALYVGGGFRTAGVPGVRGLVRWAAGTWSDVGDGTAPGISGAVDSLAVFDDGSGDALYAVGHFTAAGGLPADNIARWDGDAWTPMPGVTNSAQVACVFDDGLAERLYVGGEFLLAGGRPVHKIASWDGLGWAPLDPDPGQGLFSAGAMAVYDSGSGPELVVATGLTAGAAIVSGLARSDGMTWAPLDGPSGMGIEGDIEAFAVYGPSGDEELYVGGWFDRAGGLDISYLARWNGVRWMDVAGPGGAGLNGQVSALAVFDDGLGPLLYAGGSFEFADGQPAVGLARWNGNSWSPLPGEPIGRIVSELEVFDDGTGPALYTISSGGKPERWDGSDLVPLVTDDGTELTYMRSMAVFDDGGGPALYLAASQAGAVQACGGAPSDKIARWDGHGCSAVPGHFDQTWALTLAVADAGDGDKLYAGDYFTTIDGVVMNGIASWDGTSWSALEGPEGVGVYRYVTGRVENLIEYDGGNGPALFITGSFGEAGGRQSGAIAKWSSSLVFANGFESGDLSSWSIP